jgi:futalosine hydrolase
MALDILIVTATSEEADVLKRMPSAVNSPEGFTFGNCNISVVVTGVGSVATAWALSNWLSLNEKPYLAINAGIAGSYREEIKVGEVVVPVSDCFADAGIETVSGFMTLSESGFQDPDKFPFRKGLLVAENDYMGKLIEVLRPVRAITLNTATGSRETIDKLVSKYDPDIETMEGASFFYICSRSKIPFIGIRSVSNRVEPRDKSKWNIQLALNNLSEKTGEFLLTLG